MSRVGSLVLLTLGVGANPEISRWGQGLVTPVDTSVWERQCLRAFQLGGGFAQYGVDMDVSGFDLERMGSGLCTQWLACAFENCEFNDDAWKVLSTFRPGKDNISTITDLGLSFNLPAFMSFPKSVKDVTKIVKYARLVNKSISVKLSGNSYPGSSTRKGSVQINMQQFPKYSQTSMLRTLVQEDYTDETAGKTQYVSGPLPSALWCDYLPASSMTAACKLAKARGKPAVLRLGGGEHWDEAYRAVDDVNYFFQKWYGQTVTIVGGGAGTVGATGGWVQGNGLSTGEERRWGYGPDQILEIEMVLACGTHVKFGPSEWEAAPGFQYPKTTVVTGYCNANVDEDESKWEWKKCSSSIPFDDLWHAVRGGGGGSYGVVTAMTYQLNPRSDIEVMFFNRTVLGYVVAEATAANISVEVIQNHLIDFFVDALYNPTNVGLTSNQSASCGAPSMMLGFQALINSPLPFLICHDGAAAAIAVQYAASVEGYISTLPAGLKAIVESVKDSWANPFVVSEQASYSAFIITSLAKPYFPGPLGRVYDAPHPQVDSTTRPCISVFVPEDFLRQKNAEVHALMSFATSHVTGAYAATSHDQTSAVTEAQRGSGLQIFLCGDEQQAAFLPLFQKFWPSPAAGDNLGTGGEFNHMGSDSYGPLLTDTSKPCPNAYSHAQRDAECYSYQEFVWGTAGLRRLESIKKAVDPTNLFNCQKCVGFDASR